MARTYPKPILAPLRDLLIQSKARSKSEYLEVFVFEPRSRGAALEQKGLSHKGLRGKRPVAAFALARIGLWAYP